MISAAGHAWPSARRTAAIAALLSALAYPSTADAHGVGGGASPPIPGWLFAWVAAVVLVVSFVALAVLWPKPRLARARPRRLVRLPRWLDVSAGAVGVAVYVVVVYAGLAGVQIATVNIAPTFVFVAFWIGAPLPPNEIASDLRALLAETDRRHTREKEST